MKLTTKVAAVIVMLLTATLLMTPPPVECATSNCKIANSTCGDWQAELVNACYANFPSGGPNYQQCLDDSWNKYVWCMESLFGCPVPLKNP